MNIGNIWWFTFWGTVGIPYLQTNSLFGPMEGMEDRTQKRGDFTDPSHLPGRWWLWTKETDLQDVISLPFFWQKLQGLRHLWHIWLHKKCSRLHESRSAGQTVSLCCQCCRILGGNCWARRGCPGLREAMQRGGILVPKMGQSSARLGVCEVSMVFFRKRWFWIPKWSLLARKTVINP